MSDKRIDGLKSAITTAINNIEKNLKTIRKSLNNLKIEKEKIDKSKI